MKPATKKRSTRAIKLLLVSSAVILQGCRPRKEDVPAFVPDPLMAQSEKPLEEQAVGQPNQVQPQTVTHTGSSWGYNPFFWGYGSGYGRSGSSWSSGRSSPTNSGFFSGSGPASHFGAQNSSHVSTGHSTGAGMPTVHNSTAHTSSTHSSPSVSHGGFGSHASSASS